MATPLSRPSVRTKVLMEYLPDTPDVVAHKGWRVISVDLSTGGAKLDTATIWNDGDKISNRGLAALGGRKVTIKRDLGDGYKTIHTGFVANAHIKIGDGQDYETITTRFEPYHYGSCVRGAVQYYNGQEVVTDRPLVFNPIVDGRIVNNMNNRSSGQSGADVRDFRSDNKVYWYDPESIRTQTAIDKVQKYKPEAWTLSQAVAYLCYTLNDQKWITNPTAVQIRDTIVRNVDDIVLRDVTIPNGIYLPQALDLLLAPYGFTWRLNYSDSYFRGRGLAAIELLWRSGAPSRSIFGRSYGEVVLQPQGETLSAGSARSNAVDIDIDYNIAAAVNSIESLGSFKRFESTFVLMPGWDPRFDERPARSFALTGEFNPDVEFPRAWRDWVLGESGEYVGLRPNDARYKKPYDLSELFELSGPNKPNKKPPKKKKDAAPILVVPKRRLFLPTLSVDYEGQPRGSIQGTTIEFSVDEGKTWKPIDKLNNSDIVLLDQECGIRFVSIQIPQELYRAGAKYARVRITATIESDERLRYVADRPAPWIVDSGVQIEQAKLQIDASSQYHYRKVNKDSIEGQRSTISLGSLKSLEADDTAAIKALSDNVRAAWDMADVNGRIKIEGQDLGTYELGMIVPRISGRNIGLGASATTADNIFSAIGLTDSDRYPQIVGIAYDFNGEQSTTLTLSTFRDDL